MCVEKKIAYALVCYGAQHSGVHKKILDQVSFWRSSGYLVQLFVITDVVSVSSWKSIDEHAVILIDSNIFRKIKNRIDLIKIASFTNPSIIYLRDSFPIRIPKSKAPVIVEIQSLIGEELKSRSWTKFTLFRIFKKPTYRNLSGAVFVTRELMEVNEIRMKHQFPKVEIGNSINLERVAPLPPRQFGKPAIFFVGSPNQPWHGVFELIHFAKSNPEVNVHIVGHVGKETLSNLYFYGKLDSAGYRAVAVKCNAGVGSLNMKVNRMNQASSLKVRDYLALGLPVIMKYDDSDLNGADPHVLQLPSDGRPLADFSAEIKIFLDNWANKRVSRDKILNLDVRNKEAIRLEFMEKVLLKATSDKLPRGWK
jgi:hypothetical protein